MTLRRGTIKVVWTSPTDRIVKSRMFQSRISAFKFGSKLNDEFLVFKLQKNSFDRDFRWQLLEGGNSDLYQRAISLGVN